MTKEEAIKSIEKLYPELDKCVTDIVKARLDRNSEAEEKALFRMEGLIVRLSPARLYRTIKEKLKH